MNEKSNNSYSERHEENYAESYKSGKNNRYDSGISNASSYSTVSTWICSSCGKSNSEYSMGCSNCGIIRNHA